MAGWAFGLVTQDTLEQYKGQVGQVGGRLDHLEQEGRQVHEAVEANTQVWYGIPWYGMVWHGVVWYGMVFWITKVFSRP